MMMGAMLKREKSTIRNIEYQFLSPLIHKVAWRYMQFDTERYPVADYRFRVHGAMGAQAREFEVTQLAQLMQTVPPASPAYWILLKGIINNYNMDDKEKLVQVADQFLQNAMQPQQPQPDFDEQVKMRAQGLKEQEFQLKAQQQGIDNARKEAEMQAEAIRDRGEAIWNQSEAVLNVAKAQTEAQKAQSDSVLKEARAAQALANTTGGDTPPLEYLALVEALKDSFKDVTNNAVNQINNTLGDSLVSLGRKQFSPDMTPLNRKLDALLQQREQQAPTRMDIERGDDGRVIRIAGRPVRRGSRGELSGIE